MKMLPIGPIGECLSDRCVYEESLKLLAELSPKIAAKHARKKIARVVAGNKEIQLTDNQRDQLYNAIIDLWKDLNKHVPPFTYFGYKANLGGLGVWIDLSRLHKAEEAGILVQTGTDWKDVKSTYVLSIDDSGKLDLYRRRGRKQLWAMS